MSPQEIWQSQANDAPRISLDYLRQRADLVQGSSPRTGLTVAFNLLLGAYCVYRGFTHFTGKPFTQGFFVFVLVTAIYGAVHWMRQGPRKPLIPEDAGAIDSLHYLRREVERRISNISKYAMWGALAGSLVGAIVAALSFENGWTSHRLMIALAVQSCILPALILIQCGRRKRFLRNELAALEMLGQR